MTYSLPIDAEADVTPEWLTAILQQAGILSRGNVTTIQFTQAKYAFNSKTEHLHLSYSQDASGEMLTKLVLKRNSSQQEWYREGGQQEAHFYRLLASLPDLSAIFVRCLAAEYDERSGNSYVILEDLSDTHIPLIDKVPLATTIETVIDIFAHFHAYWWEHPQLGSAIGPGRWQRDRAHFELYHQQCMSAWQLLLLHEQDWLPEEIRQSYEQMLYLLPRLWERYWEPRFASKTQLTVIHGDAYFIQFLVPRDDRFGQTYLIDWQRPKMHIGVSDLVHMCDTFWTRAIRQEGQRELHLLQRYYDLLCTYGVKNYTWEELLIDYRSQLIEEALFPVLHDCLRTTKHYWWPKIQCLMAAVEDWQCLKLLE
ncbi:DUF1679 domain-containing protein [Dictyobacter formicarum]|uniref:Aminoglycoside phosphotransferase n=1 Tax=Dictyobacter formicarum TaxID=2778368 RepID=A0ABQ3VAU3_9CHLR|nr:DUF1679 domain-containing protein [Dictyobacter formicarum]GHO82336.1 aminoglycoside phosphotransferase [Dictyobacter formicarum]